MEEFILCDSALHLAKVIENNPFLLCLKTQRSSVCSFFNLPCARSRTDLIYHSLIFTGTKVRLKFGVLPRVPLGFQLRSPRPRPPLSPCVPPPLPVVLGCIQATWSDGGDTRVFGPRRA